MTFHPGPEFIPLDKHCFCACWEQTETGACDCTRRMDREIEEQIKDRLLPAELDPADGA